MARSMGSLDTETAGAAKAAAGEALPPGVGDTKDVVDGVVALVLVVVFCAPDEPLLPLPLAFFAMRTL